MKKLKMNTKITQSGQALVTLIVFAAVASMILTGAVAVSLETTRATSGATLGQETKAIAEAAANSAILRLVRDPSYTGETMTIGNGTATIVVSGSTTKTITINAVNGSYRRQLQVIGSYTNNVFSVTSWIEI
jgi:type II secretory pathway component PulK